LDVPDAPRGFDTGDPTHLPAMAVPIEKLMMKQ
jgi:hypothetical protein